MNRVAVLIALILFAFAAADSRAHLRDDNPRASIAFVGEHSFTGPPGSVLPRRFVVRVVNSEGEPLPGLRVQFFSDITFTCCGTPPGPPASFYGEFEGSADPLNIRTDANGTATSPPFRVGQGGHDVAAGIYGFAAPENAAAVGWPSIAATFHVNRVVTEPPEPDPAGGVPAATALPATSVPGLAFLVIAMVLVAAAARQRARRHRAS